MRSARYSVECTWTKVFAASAIRSRLCRSSCNSSVEIEGKWTLTWCYSKRSKTKTTRPKLMFLVSIFIWKTSLSDGPSHFVISFCEVPRSVFWGPPCIPLPDRWWNLFFRSPIISWIILLMGQATMKNSTRKNTTNLLRQMIYIIVIR